MNGADLSLHVIQPFRPVPPAADHRRRERGTKPFELERAGREDSAPQARDGEPQSRAASHEDGIGEHIDIVA